MQRRIPSFVNQYRAAMREFVGTILSYNPDVVLAVTRKGPRLLELYERFEVTASLGVPIISEKSIPFLGRAWFEGKRVVACDDIAIYGSTLKDVLEQLRNAGAEAIPVTLAIDRQWLNTDLVDPVHQLDLAPDQVQSFNRSLVRAFQSLGRPYDVDHPILSLAGMLPARQEYIARATKTGRKVFDLTSSVHDEFGLVNLTIDDPYPSFTGSLFNRDCVSTADGIRKIRLIADIESGRVRMVPMTTFSLNVAALRAGERLFSAEASDLNRVFDDSIKALVTMDWSVDSISKAIYRLAMYLAAYAYGRAFVRKWGMSLGLRVPTKDEKLLELHDLDILFGREVGATLQDRLTQIDWENLSDLTETEGEQRLAERQEPQRTKPVAFLMENAKVDVELFERLKDPIRGAIKPRQDLVTNLNSIFRQLYLHIDLEQRRRRVYEPERLSVGFTHGYVKNILHSHRVKFQDWQLSACLDYSVDCGSIVPIVVSTVSGVCTRAYRFGESQFSIGPDELRYASAVLAEHLCNVYKKLFKRPTASVPRTVFEKVTAFVWTHLDRMENPEFKDINIELKFHRHGARLAVLSKLDEPWYADWCLNNAIIKKQKDGPYEFNPAFFEEYRREDNPVPRWFTADLKSLVTLLVKIVKERSDPARGYETLLAVTTCNSERNLIRAVRKDLELWFTDHATNARTFLASLAEIVQEARKDIQAFEAGLMRFEKRFNFLVAKAKRTSQTLVDLSGECKHKFSVFDRLPETKAHIDRLFVEGSDLSEALGDQYERFFFDVFDTTQYPGNREKRERLKRLVELCEAFAWVCRSLVHEEVLQEKGKVARGHSLGTDLVSFAEARRRFTEAEPLFLVSSLNPAGQTRIERLSTFCRQATEVLNQLQNTYELLCVEPQIPLMKPASQDECIIVYDIIGSAKVFSKEESSAKKLALKKEVEQYCRSTLRDKMTDSRPDTEDSGGYVVKLPPNAVRTMVFLRDRARDVGFQVRVGGYWTKGRERLYESVADGTKGGGPFEVAARLSTYYKDKELEKPGTSYVFVNVELVQELRRSQDSLLKSFSFERLGRLSPRGQGLPELTVYRLVDRAESVS